MDESKDINENKVIILVDRLFKIIMFLACLAGALIIIGAIFILISNIFGFLAFHLNYVFATIVALGLALLYFQFPNGWYGSEIQKFSSSRLHRIIITTIGLFIIWVLMNSNDYFRVYNDGYYCAYVNYSTEDGDSFTYITVEVYEGYITELQMDYEGSLDSRHFDPYSAPVDRDGTAFFRDNRDREFYVELISRGETCK